MGNRALFKARELTQARLKELLSYNPKSGFFRWKARRGGQPKGSVAGCVASDTGYIQIYVDYKNHFGHRLAWLYMTGRWPDPEADHRNGTRYDNRWSNLREATRGEQQQNTSGRRNKSGYRGVRWKPEKQRFSAEIVVNGRRMMLGQGFLTAEEASAAYLAAKARLHTFNPTVRDLPKSAAR